MMSFLLLQNSQGQKIKQEIMIAIFFPLQTDKNIDKASTWGRCQWRWWCRGPSSPSCKFPASPPRETWTQCQVLRCPGNRDLGNFWTFDQHRSLCLIHQDNLRLQSCLSNPHQMGVMGSKGVEPEDRLCSRGSCSAYKEELVVLMVVVVVVMNWWGEIVERFGTKVL